MKKLKIGVLFGGLSAEHEVSIKSAISIIKNLNTDKYIIIPIYVNTKGEWNYIDMPLSTYNIDPLGFMDHIMQCIEQIKIQESSSNCHIKPINLGEISQLVDVLFPIIHGKNR